MIAFERVLAAIRVVGWSRLPEVEARAHAEQLYRAMAQYEVNTPRGPCMKRVAAFLAQWAHETGGWRWMHELGGPSYFKKYDGRRDLGNVQPGDGYRFRGRGYPMLTGRSNYDQYGQKLGLPLVENPDLAEKLSVSADIAGLFWDDHHLNPLADDGKFRQICIAINGGLNGYEDRKAKFGAMMHELSREIVARR